MSVPLPTINNVTPLATVVLAIWAAVFTYRSWRDSREKIRLDLFDRRFDIYLRTLSLYQVLLNWKDTDEQKALVDPFLKAGREARFIFPSNSGGYEYLEEFGLQALGIIHFKASMALYPEEGMHHARADLIAARLDHAKWIRNSIVKLEDLMKPYMSFERL